jgi:uncharacterized membrane protein YdbT with pleckstrin-like domain
MKHTDEEYTALFLESLQSSDSVVPNEVYKLLFQILATVVAGLLVIGMSFFFPWTIILIIGLFCYWGSKD